MELPDDLRFLPIHTRMGGVVGWLVWCLCLVPCDALGGNARARHSPTHDINRAPHHNTAAIADEAFDFQNLVQLGLGLASISKT